MPPDRAPDDWLRRAGAHLVKAESAVAAGLPPVR